MCMCDIVDLEEALKKTGPDLFKELYRVYPVADPEDYFKNGQWRNDLMKSDLTLLEAHRREAGAPDAPDIDAITFPQMPMQAATPTLGGVKLAAGQGVVPGAGAQVVEIRLIALFVAKWKLDPATAKECLSKLTPARRRYVIQQFKTTSSGVEATEELKTFIAACEKDGKWDTGATTTVTSGITIQVAKAGALRPTIMPKLSPAVATPKVAAITPARPGTLATTIAPVSGVKRPISQVVSAPAWAAIKRPILAAGTPAAVKPNVISPPKAGKAGPATIRPPVRPGGKLISGLLSNF